MARRAAGNPIAALASAAALGAATPVIAGPPFLTDDPEPTETGHWEIYGPLIELEGRGAQVSGSAGVEVNYGASPGVQVTVGLPVALERDAGQWQAGAGDVALSVKYRFYHDEAGGWQAAVFPGVTLPTARTGLGAGRVTGLLPVWVQKDAGRLSLFGGGGYAINPGPGNRDYWTGGIAATRTFGDRNLIGVEIDRDGPAQLGERASTSLGAGVIHRLDGRLRLLASGGPTFPDGGGPARFHVFAALGIDL